MAFSDLFIQLIFLDFVLIWFFSVTLSMIVSLFEIDWKWIAKYLLNWIICQIAWNKSSDTIHWCNEFIHDDDVDNDDDELWWWIMMDDDDVDDLYNDC